MTVRAIFTRRGEGAGEFDEVTGDYTGPERALVGEADVRVQVLSAAENTVTAGEQVVTLQQYRVSATVGLTGVHVDDRCTISAIGADDDPDLLGLVLRVRSVITGSLLWQRDLVCEVDEG